MVFGASRRSPGGRPEGNSAPPPQIYEEERIDIPGTHVPAWVVVGIVIAVVAALAATAFILLR